ncbi:DUF6112 family protein [Pengzhenrongella sp.]|jgi:high-affinity Fe2+/Pb2+ permease|uniref:DUF6112 family protein n=1 Tax=Pengzhenrongella sp. TaxID=2888820 RepID=UPI002F921698
MLNSLAAHAVVHWDVIVPKPSGTPPKELTDKIGALLGIVMIAVAAACVLGVLITAIKMAIAWGRGELGESAKGLVGVLIACVLAGSASALVGYAIN